MDDVKRVVAAAQVRGIQVVLELDLPAHSLSWGMTMPELFSRCPKGTTFWHQPVNPLSEKFYALYEVR